MIKKEVEDSKMKYVLKLRDAKSLGNDLLQFCNQAHEYSYCYALKKQIP